MLTYLVSGEVADVPVVSPKSRKIFEKRLVENYIEINGTDPISGQPLSKEELIEMDPDVSSITPPKPPSCTSIPSLLSTFQNEWDALALENFSIRKQLHRAREELSSALYHHDAAVRVASRLINERDEARKALQQLVTSIGVGEKTEIGTVDADTKDGRGEEDDLVQHVPVDEISSARDELFQLHKSQKINLPINPEADIQIQYFTKHIQPLKKCTLFYFLKDSNSVFMSGQGNTLFVLDLERGSDALRKISYKGTMTALSEAFFQDEIVPLFACHNKLFIGEKKELFKHPHEGDIIQIILHPSLKHLFVALSADCTWSLNNCNSKVSYFRSSQINGLTTGALHVDGALLAIGSDESQITLFNLTDAMPVLQLSTKFPKVKKLIFALNGYWLLSLSYDDNASCLEIFDLRKSVVTHSIESEECLQDFDIDPSSSLILTASARNISLHRYLRKGKQWLNYVQEKSLEERSSLKSISITTNAEQEQFKLNGLVNFVTVFENSLLVEFQLQSVLGSNG